MTEQTTIPSDKSVEDLEQLVAARPDSAGHHYNLGLALSQRGDWDRAIDEFKAALKIQPGLFEARINIAGILLQKGEYDQSIRTKPEGA